MRPPQVSGSGSQAATTGRTFRVYQVWKGSNRFCLGGRLIFGPDARSILLTLSLIVIPAILFCIFVSPRLNNEFLHHVGKLIVAICIAFTVYDVFLLILTSGRDPGIIPRNAHPPEPEEDGSIVSADWPASLVGAPSVPPTKDVVVNGMVVKVKYCQTCMLYRPPRCSHCSICNNCVERFDHHCPWVGQCIGKRNYRFFFMFVSSTTILCLYVFAFCWVNVIKIMNGHHCNVWKAFAESPFSGILIVYTFIAAWFVGGLTVFHIYLISTNQTTYENFRYRYAGKMNPYNVGCARNIMEIFCSRIPSSRNNFRAKVKVDPSVFGNSLSFGRSASPEIPKISSDVEMGKRQAVGVEHLEDIQSQIESVGGLERCSTHPRHTSLDEKASLEITHDMHAVAAEFGMDYGATDKPKLQEDH